MCETYHTPRACVVQVFTLQGHLPASQKEKHPAGCVACLFFRACQGPVFPKGSAGPIVAPLPAGDRYSGLAAKKVLNLSSTKSGKKARSGLGVKSLAPVKMFLFTPFSR